MKRSPLKRKKRINRVSAKQKGRTALYYWLREPFMKAHPVCQICRNAISTDVHHVKGRRGALLFDQKYWLSLCRPCHCEVHENPKWAIENGYLMTNK